MRYRYLPMLLDRVNAMNDEDFYAQRINGYFLWGGTPVDSNDG
jgi:hypothetical protein